MSLAIVYSRAQEGMQSQLVTVETHLSNGLPGFQMVGLPETAVKESRDRVRSALLNAGFDFPSRRITVNLAPADLPKEGSRYDLPIAVGILAASKQIPLNRLNEHEWMGELALSGELRPVSSPLAMALGCKNSGRTLILPTLNTEETTLIPDLNVMGANHLLEVVAYLRGYGQLRIPSSLPPSPSLPVPDLSDIKGQFQAKRALEIAAAGGHNILFSGPPGTGKTMLAQRLTGILPPLNEAESTEVAVLNSLSNHSFLPSHYGIRPFRAPHHTASPVAMVGGGSHPKPGEISLAHLGVLFLDELPEYDRKVLEVLREPLESGKILISRASRKTEYPAQFQLIAAMNPCPCGHLGDPKNHCRCSPQAIQRYRGKLSGPLLDRIDLHVNVTALTAEELQQTVQTLPQSTTADVKSRVIQARHRQLSRQHILNHALQGKELEHFCALSPESAKLLATAFDKLGLSARAYHRLLKISRTIADLSGSDTLSTQHLTEALGFRRTEPGRVHMI